MHYSFRFLLATLAVWRVTHLLSREDGPWDLLLRFRRALGSGMLSKLVACFYCLSLWVALPFAWFLTASWIERVVSWLAVSAAAILLERATAEPLNLQIKGD